MARHARRRRAPQHEDVLVVHAFGDAPKFDSEVRTIGSNTGRLMSTDHHYEPISGLPMMSAIPVNVRRSDENLSLLAST